MSYHAKAIGSGSEGAQTELQDENLYKDFCKRTQAKADKTL
jgi:20S proteasome alpha/beta subunit